MIHMPVQARLCSTTAPNMTTTRATAAIGVNAGTRWTSGTKINRCRVAKKPSHDVCRRKGDSRRHLAQRRYSSVPLG